MKTQASGSVGSNAYVARVGHVPRGLSHSEHLLALLDDDAEWRQQIVGWVCCKEHLRGCNNITYSDGGGPGSHLLLNCCDRTSPQVSHPCLTRCCACTCMGHGLSRRKSSVSVGDRQCCHKSLRTWHLLESSQYFLGSPACVAVGTAF